MKDVHGEEIDIMKWCGECFTPRHFHSQDEYERPFTCTGCKKTMFARSMWWTKPKEADQKEAKTKPKHTRDVDKQLSFF